MKKYILCGLIAATAICRTAAAFAQNVPVHDSGLKHHNFLYMGEWDTRHPEAQLMTIVKNGKQIWKKTIPLQPEPGHYQEFDDATMLPNGNIVYAQMSRAGMITPDNRTVWEYICPAGTETHSCQPVGKDSVLMALNGTPARVLIINTATSQVLKEIFIPTSGKQSHGQFRHVRFTAAHTILLGLMTEKKVVEYDLEGKELWSVNADSPWAAVRLKNGNTLISGDWSGYVREVSPDKKIVWELTQADVPFRLFNTQTANRLANGNTMICNWVGGNAKTAEWAATIQAFEVTPDKKVVWTLSSWDNPDLGTCTSIQLLDKKGRPDPGDTQR